MKAQANFTIEVDLLLELDKLGVNKSALIEKLIRNYLSISPTETKDLTKEIQLTAAKLVNLQERQRRKERQEEKEIEEAAKKKERFIEL